MEALVIVHLSSLDSYQEKEGVHAAEGLARRILLAAKAHRGPVYVIDQRWPIRERSSRVRRDLVHALTIASLQKDLEWLFWNESEQDWGFFLRDFLERLRQDGVERAVVGGIWYDPKGEMGCATDVERALRDLMPVKVARGLVACWDSRGKEGGVLSGSPWRARCR